jgi:thioredoxin 1
MAAIHVTKETFKQEVLESDVPVLVDFWAEWCGPCQMVLPIVEKLGEELTDVKICKVNVDEQMDLAREYRVMSIPTFLLFKEGQVVKKELGARTKEELLSMLGK